MSLTPCKECKQQVSTKAPTCPNCGTPDPATPTAAQLIGSFVALGLVLSCGYWLWGLGSGPDEPTVAPTAPVASIVMASEYGERWPLTVARGELQCLPPNQVVFINESRIYALNGMARNRMESRGWRDIQDIWQDDPNLDGTPKMPISALVERGLSFCEPSITPSA
jgi:hypothetical protein